VGRVSKEKDLDVIVAAAKKLADSGLRIANCASADTPIPGFSEAEESLEERHAFSGARAAHESDRETSFQRHGVLTESPIAIRRGERGGAGSGPGDSRANPQSPIVFAFVGDGPYLKELRSLLPFAAFTGYLAGLELARAFASSDVFLFPSTTDTFGNVILEAMASGVPCVVSDQGGPKDLIAHGKTGFITRAFDADDFTHSVEKIVTDPSLRREMAIAAHDAVQGRDWAEAGRKFWELSPE